MTDRYEDNGGCDSTRLQLGRHHEEKGEERAGFDRRGREEGAEWVSNAVMRRARKHIFTSSL